MEHDGHDGATTDTKDYQGNNQQPELPSSSAESRRVRRGPVVPVVVNVLVEPPVASFVDIARAEPAGPHDSSSIRVHRQPNQR